MGVILAAEDGGEPFRGGLLAGDEAFCAELGRVNCVSCEFYCSYSVGLRAGFCVVCERENGENSRTMPDEESTFCERVSTAMTCGVFSFQEQYFRQFAVDTSSHEYSNSLVEENTFMMSEVDVVFRVDGDRGIYGSGENISVSILLVNAIPLLTYNFNVRAVISCWVSIEKGSVC